jgi:hypothetical protein
MTGWNVVPDPDLDMCPSCFAEPSDYDSRNPFVMNCLDTWHLRNAPADPTLDEFWNS